jgi:hypothetical protein
VADFSWPTAIVPAAVSPLQRADILRSVGLTGRTQRRGTLNQSWTFAETYPPFRINSDAGAQLLAAVTRCLSGDRAVMTALAYVNNFTPSFVGVVNGAGQTGDSLNFRLGVSSPDSAVRAGSVFAFAGNQTVYQVVETRAISTATVLKLSHPITSARSPADGVQLQFFPHQTFLYPHLLEATPIPSARGAYWLEGLTLRWVLQPV